MFKIPKYRDDNMFFNQTNEANLSLTIISDLSLFPDIVYDKILSLKEDKGNDPDYIQVLQLKKCTVTINLSLCDFFN